MITRRFRPAVVLAALLASIGSARAEAPAASGFALSHYEPAPPGGGWFALDGLDLRGHLRPSIGLGIDWAYKPLVVYNPDGTERAALVEHQAVGHLGGALVLWNGLRLSFDVPFAAFQSGESLTTSSMRFDAPSKPALGDVRVGADLRLAGDSADGLVVALGMRAWLPTGDAQQYLGDGKLRFSPRLLLAGNFGHFTLAADAGYRSRTAAANFPGADSSDEIDVSLGLGLRALDGRLRVGPELFASTRLGSADELFERLSSPVEGLFGVHYELGAGFILGAGAGGGMSRGLGSPRLRAVGSLEWSAPREAAPADGDGDGIADGRDACPREAGPASADPKANGCPPPSDRDRDGIADAKDACPDKAGVADRNPELHGCPAGKPPPDRDADGIADAKDACPDKAGVPSAERKRHGCPNDHDLDGVADVEDACPGIAGDPSSDPQRHGCPPDADQDGVADAKDGCPQVAGIAHADPKRNGCPPDRDRDGVADAQDACPEVAAGATPDPTRAGCPLRDTDTDGVADSLDNCPEDKGPAANQGCPVKQKQLVVITRDRLQINDKVYFATNKAAILKKSFKLLDQIASVIKAHPEIGRVLIEGHTDNRGSAARNRKLSQERAESVRKYLLGKGLPGERLLAKGWGPDRPAASNASAKGREANRRVEFIIAGHEEPAAVEATIDDLVPLAPLVPAKGKKP